MLHNQINKKNIITVIIKYRKCERNHMFNDLKQEEQYKK